MALTVVVRSGGEEPLPSLTLDAPRVIIGRGPGCEIRLPDPSVSLRHASVRQRGIDYIIVDEGSTNGTFVGPVRLAPGAPRVILSGDRVRVGRVWLEIKIGTFAPTVDAPAATKEMAIQLVAASLAAAGEGAFLEIQVTSGPDIGAKVSLQEFGRSYSVGRGADADLALTDEDCSRRHAEFVRRGDALFVKDLASKNGVHLSSERIPPNKDVKWTPGASLQIGLNRFDFVDPVAEVLRELDAAADEQMHPGDVVEQPAGDPEPAPVPQQVTASPRPRVVRRARGADRWSRGDYAIALLALLVLGVSMLAFTWLRAE